MPTPTYRIRGSQVERENVPQEWAARARPDFGIYPASPAGGMQVGDPALAGLRQAAGEPSYDEIMSAAHRTLDETAPTQAHFNTPRLEAGEAENPIIAGGKRILGSLAQQPLWQASGTPAGLAMSLLLQAPIQAGMQAAKAARMGSELAHQTAAWGEAVPQTIRHAPGKIGRPLEQYLAGVKTPAATGEQGAALQGLRRAGEWARLGHPRGTTPTTAENVSQLSPKHGIELGEDLTPITTTEEEMGRVNNGVSLNELKATLMKYLKGGAGLADDAAMAAYRLQKQ
jgi:hypothetical protein